MASSALSRRHQGRLARWRIGQALGGGQNRRRGELHQYMGNYDPNKVRTFWIRFIRKNRAKNTPFQTVSAGAQPPASRAYAKAPAPRSSPALYFYRAELLSAERGAAIPSPRHAHKRRRRGSESQRRAMHPQLMCAARQRSVPGTRAARAGNHPPKRLCRGPGRIGLHPPATSLIKAPERQVDQAFVLRGPP